MNLQRSMNWMWTWHRPWAPQGARPELQPQEEVVVPEPDLQVALMEIGPHSRLVRQEPAEQQVAGQGLQPKENWNLPYKRPKIYDLEVDMTQAMGASSHL